MTHTPRFRNLFPNRARRGASQGDWGRAPNARSAKFLTNLWQLTQPYWVSEERWRARLLLAVIVGLSLAQVYISVLLNKWNSGFYNALQAVDKAAFLSALVEFSWLAAIAITIGVYKTYLNQMLRIRWRRWMTAQYLGNWLEKQNYWRMQLAGSTTDNPDQRIAEDIEQFIALTLGLSLGLLSAVVTLFSFLGILWGLSGTLEFALMGRDFAIPGYMVWVAVIYAALGTWVTVKIGAPLVMLNFNQQRFEADFRFSLIRLRENSESIAFYRGEPREQEQFLSRMGAVVDNFWAIMKRQKLLNWFTSGYNQIAIIFPILVASPRFFSGQIQLGGLTQTASAFGQVQEALSFIIDAYGSIASWKAVIDRLNGFHTGLAQAEALAAPVTVHESNALTLEGVTLALPDGKPLLGPLSLKVQSGDSLLITGRSGAGKSTLLRALAGLWPYVEGKIQLPPRERMLFLPQKPYLPLGSLRETLCYPLSVAEVSNEALHEALVLCRLEHLALRLEETANWSQTLSPGEQQRLAFARALLLKPEFVFLDEATSALDEATEAHLYHCLREQLPEVAIVSVGHRSALKAWHRAELALS
jgi:vitamin B12/bleomycin/antimicrobial peptide transport system ATP-binding/permease protein